MSCDMDINQTAGSMHDDGNALNEKMLWNPSILHVPENLLVDLNCYASVH